MTDLMQIAHESGFKLLPYAWTIRSNVWIAPSHVSSHDKSNPESERAYYFAIPAYYQLLR